MINGPVITWQMTEEERLEYIKKHPIIPISKKDSYAGVEERMYRRVKEKKMKPPAPNHKPKSNSPWHKQSIKYGEDI
ncbi:hypothetical protein M3175_07900 [Robertmurraya korlensis]|uniref:hypothetical protein n=1 Tax=Robertmurraya korlensis TaxID=519977 RepID=UPI002040E0E3|nr:hypothetical protein [Robertmurraya korlensis]MCM3600650.1 hypothetical protein [Robertmurraya korlensis]